MSSKISGLTAGTPKSGDLHVAVDVTDMTMASTGTDKKYTWSELKADILQLTAVGQVAFGDTTFDGDLIGSNDLVYLVGQNSLGIGTPTPSASAILQLVSTTQGLGLPTVTTTQRNAIASPIAGLVVYNSTLHSIDYYNGSAWITIPVSVNNTTSQSVQYTGAWSSGPVNFINTQIFGEQVTVMFQGVSQNATISSLISSSTDIDNPPARTQTFMIPVIDNGVSMLGTLTIASSGDISIGVNTVGINNVQNLQPFSGLSTNGATGFPTFSVTYLNI
jgi:hypothetical protein